MIAACFFAHMAPEKFTKLRHTERLGNYIATRRNLVPVPIDDEEFNCSSHGVHMYACVCGVGVIIGRRVVNAKVRICCRDYPCPSFEQNRVQKRDRSCHVTIRFKTGMRNELCGENRVGLLSPSNVLCPCLFHVPACVGNVK